MNQHTSSIRASHINDGTAFVGPTGPGGPGGFPEVESTMTPSRTGGLGMGVHLVRDADGNPTGGVAQYFEQPIYVPAD